MKADVANQDKPKAPEKPDALQQVIQWLLEGQTETDIAAAIKKTYPRVQQRPLILRARGEIAKASEIDPDEVLGFAMLGTKDVYRRAIAAGDMPVALRALKQLRELAAE